MQKVTKYRKEKVRHLNSIPPLGQEEIKGQKGQRSTFIYRHLHEHDQQH